MYLRLLTGAVVVLLMLLAASCAPEPEVAPDPEELPREHGRLLYEARCAVCHLSDGTGTRTYPSLRRSRFIQSDPPAPVIELVLYGSGLMPGFHEELDEEDTAAVLSYLRSTFGNAAGPVSPEEVAATTGAWEHGRALYQAHCAVCHRDDGMGTAAFPGLRQNAFVRGNPPDPLIELLLHGEGLMPGFARELDDEEMAALLTYIRNHFGNQGLPVTADQIAEVREESDEQSVMSDE